MRRRATFRTGVVALGLLLAACGTGRSLVTEPPQRKPFSTATLMRSDDTVVVPEQYRAQFLSKIREVLYGTNSSPGPFKEGAGLTIRVKVIQFEEGSQFQRWFWGGLGNAGEGSMHVIAEYMEGDTKLGQTQVEGRIGSGLFGGSMSQAVDKAAEQIGSYAVTNFR